MRRFRTVRRVAAVLRDRAVEHSNPRLGRSDSIRLAREVVDAKFVFDLRK